MTSVGKVIKIENDRVTVSVKRKGACGDNCASCSSSCNQIMNVSALCDLPVKIGDEVILETKSKYVFVCLLMVFILPIVLPLLTYFLFCVINHTLSVFASLFTFALSFFLIFIFGKNKRITEYTTPVVVAINNK